RHRARTGVACSSCPGPAVSDTGADPREPGDVRRGARTVACRSRTHVIRGTDYLVYVGNAGSQTISVLGLTREGDLKRIEEVIVPGAGEPSVFSLPLALSPDRRFLYAALRTPPFPISTFRIASDSGRLAHIASAP